MSDLTVLTFYTGDSDYDIMWAIYSNGVLHYASDLSHVEQDFEIADAINKYRPIESLAIVTWDEPHPWFITYSNDELKVPTYLKDIPDEVWEQSRNIC